MLLRCYTGNFTIGLTNVHPLVSSPLAGNYNVCGHYLDQGVTARLQCENTDLQPARYVVVQLPVTDRLHLCELEVYASEGLFIICLYHKLYLTSRGLIILSLIHI